MIQVTYKRQGPTIEEIEKNIATLFIESKEAARALAVDTRDYMRDIIQTSKKRKSGSRDNLENAIEVDELPTTEKEFHFGVGNIRHLDEVAPYWLLLNYGGLPPIARNGRTIYGAFDMKDPPDSSLRGTGKGTQSFFLSRFGSTPTFPMTPKNPIAPVKYIEKTFSWFQTHAFLVMPVKGNIKVFAK